MTRLLLNPELSATDIDLIRLVSWMWLVGGAIRVLVECGNTCVKCVRVD